MSKKLLGLAIGALALVGVLGTTDSAKAWYPSPYVYPTVATYPFFYPSIYTSPYLYSNPYLSPFVSPAFFGSGFSPFFSHHRHRHHRW
jgi:hypothetical protein